VASGACTPFAGNRIPTNRLDPVALALLAHVPQPTSGGAVQNLLSTANEVNPMNQFSIKLDHRFGVSDTVFGRVTSYRVDDTQPFGTTSLSEALVPGFGGTVTTHSENVALGYTRTFGSKWLNEVRFGYLRASGGQVSPNQGVNFGALAGLQGVTQNAADTGYPQVAFGDLFSAIGDPTTFVSRDDRSYEVYDNVMVDRGAHRLKFGGYLFRLDFNPVNPSNARGNFTFNGQWTGNAFADFLLGYPSSSQVGIGRADEHGRSTWFQPHTALWTAVRSQRSDVRRRQSTFGYRHPKWALCHRERRQRQCLTERDAVSVTDSHSVHLVPTGRMDPSIASSELFAVRSARRSRVDHRQ
jgi:hypothetical protein